MFEFIAFLWFFRTTKIALFYLYLWQLKEYHIGRFLAHFETKKSKQLIFNPLNILKIILLIAFPVLPLLTFLGTILLYLIEFIKTAFAFLTKRSKLPILTKKTIFLIFTSLILEMGLILFAFFSIDFWGKFKIFNLSSEIVIFSFWLLVFDVFAPIIFSIIILLFQPLAVLMRNKILNRAKIKRSQFKNLLVIGITGSYGKTSTKEFLYTILCEKFGKEKVLKTKEHQNSEVGISKCILNDLTPEHEIFVCEMGAYNRGGIKLLCNIAKPKIGVLTGINEQHMATFGSQDNIIKAKFELLEALPNDGVAVVNGDNELINKKLKNQSVKLQCKIKKYSLEDDSARVISLQFSSSDKQNILAAIATAKELGMTDEEVSRGLVKIKPSLIIKKGFSGLNIIDSSYSANPTGVMADLDFLAQQSGNPEGEPSVPYGARKIIIMPCLIELGQSSKEVHRRIGKKIAEVCDLAIITTEDKFKELKEGFIDGGGKEKNIIFMDNSKEIFKKIENLYKEGGTVLLESRVPKQLIKQLTSN